MPSQPSPKNPAAPLDSKERILDAALELFATNGFAGTSMRMITQKAGVSLALVNYHFKSKDQLRMEVVLQRLAPINAERIARLDALEAHYGDDPVPLEKLADAGIRPMVMLNTGRPEALRFYALFVMRCMMSPDDDFRFASFEVHLNEMFQRYFQALHKTLSEPMESIYWKMHFFGSCMLATLAQPERLEFLSGGTIKQDDPEETIQRLTTFLCDGFRADFDSMQPHNLENFPNP
jgi:AcrR family transcriptional regulator